MFELSVRGDIASAHFIEGHEGQCRDLHGHTWKIEATVMSDRLDTLGMVADFSLLKEKFREVLVPIDHACLNDVPFFEGKNPTTENVAQYVYAHFKEAIKPLRIKDVRVWESDTSSVRYCE